MSAQVPRTGSIQGVVLDDAGSGIAGVSVWPIGNEFGARTDSTGRFVMLGVPIGTYQVHFAFDGLSQFMSNVVVEAGRTADIEMDGLTTCTAFGKRHVFTRGFFDSSPFMSRRLVVAGDLDPVY